MGEWQKIAQGLLSSTPVTTGLEFGLSMAAASAAKHVIDTYIHPTLRLNSKWMPGYRAVAMALAFEVVTGIARYGLEGKRAEHAGAELALNAAEIGALALLGANAAWSPYFTLCALGASALAAVTRDCVIQGRSFDASVMSDVALSAGLAAFGTMPFLGRVVGTAEASGMKRAYRHLIDDYPRLSGFRSHEFVTESVGGVLFHRAVSSENQRGEGPIAKGLVVLLPGFERDAHSCHDMPAKFLEKGVQAWVLEYPGSLPPHYRKGSLGASFFSSEFLTGHAGAEGNEVARSYAQSVVQALKAVREQDAEVPILVAGHSGGAALAGWVRALIKNQVPNIHFLESAPPYKAFWEKNFLTKLIQWPIDVGSSFVGSLRQAQTVGRIGFDVRTLLERRSAELLNGEAAPLTVMLGGKDRLVLFKDSCAFAQEVLGARVIPFPDQTHHFWREDAARQRFFDEACKILETSTG